MKFLILLSVVAALSGCAATAPTWKAVASTDEFTDVTTKLVTVGEFSTAQGIYTKSMALYPFVGLRNGEIIVGVRSGGRFRVPAGQVQLRIDDNTAWMIATEETPLYLAPEVQALPAMTADAKANAVMGEAQKQVMASVHRSMSPFTATTGDKAKQILNQMLGGKRLIYRSVGINQAGGRTGEVVLDESLATSLRGIGIDPDALQR